MKHRTLNTVIQLNTAPYTEVFNQTVTLTPAWQHYVLSFTPKMTAQTVLSFNAAQNTGQVWIDGVSLSK